MLPQIVTVNRMAKHRRKRHRVKNRHHRHHRHVARVSNRHRRHRRRVQNPFKIPGIPRDYSDLLVPALLGGAGGIGVDVGLAYATFLPASLTSGWGRIAVQIAAALGIGYVAGMAFGKRTGTAVAAGGLTITAYSALRQVLAPTLGNSIKGLSGLADFSDYRAAWPGELAVGGSPTAYAGGLSAYMPRQPMGAYMARRPMGAYMPRAGLGYMNPGSILTGIRGKQMALAGFGGTWSEDM